ncbi:MULTISPECIES: TetR/AcrR family transcriptional regulator [unclassified Ensifer]|uniref:TetR/AcrR family transcriptional regulator n=2 Tax=Ensifer TaxID=106591 RepID=UPI000813A64F|nr:MULTISPECIES: TetR/AcrR family transcriptional regulator [unclassified Ensifer]OCP05526.1 TetR family transcriptional regulator [Ensifer sp. LC14]OCP06945.1 TetR family transcriptional regulator [Ensifer sp. LC11]OCP07462.1 TetR family transcriptional regulator [Ensifer sp. LC13]OCP31763.1 TetR family transcriptional regulator [Ensifer sp. LC499]
MRRVDPEKHAAKRRLILDAAITCFSRKGFHGTSTAEICAEAGMSPGNLFHYFPTKHTIIAAIVEEERQETAEIFRKLSEEQDLLAALLGFMDTVLELASDPTFSSLALEIAAEAMRDERIGTLAARNDAELQAALAALLRGAASRSQIDQTIDAAGAARWIAAIIDGIFSRVAVDPGFRPKDEGLMLRRLLTRFLRP